MTEKLPATISRVERGISVPADYHPDSGTSTATIANVTGHIVSSVRDVGAQGDDTTVDVALHREVDGRTTMSLKFRSYKYRKTEK